MREEMYRTLEERIVKLEQENKELRAMIEEQIYHFMYMFRKDGDHGIITKNYRKHFLEGYFKSQISVEDKEFLFKILLCLKIPIKLHPLFGKDKEYLEMSDLKPENVRLISESINYYGGDYNFDIIEKIKELDNQTCETLYIIIMNQHFKELIDGLIHEELEDLLKKLKNELKKIEERDKYFRTEIPFISKQEYLPTSTSKKMWEIYEKFEKPIKIQETEYKKKVVQAYIEKLKEHLNKKELNLKS